MTTQEEYQTRNREITRLREAGGTTLRGLAAQFDLSVERIRQIVAVTLHKERQRIQREKLEAEFRAWVTDMRRGGPDEDPNIPPDYEPPFTGRPLARLFTAALKPIIRAARQANADRQALENTRAKHGIKDDDRAWTVLLLTRLHHQHLAKEAAARHERWYTGDNYGDEGNYSPPVYSSRTKGGLSPRPQSSWPYLSQEEMQLKARELHWTEVVYENGGGDKIVRLEKRK